MKDLQQSSFFSWLLARFVVSLLLLYQFFYVSLALNCIVKRRLATTIVIAIAIAIAIYMGLYGMSHGWQVTLLLLEKTRIFSDPILQPAEGKLSLFRGGWCEHERERELLS